VYRIIILVIVLKFIVGGREHVQAIQERRSLAGSGKQCFITFLLKHFAGRDDHVEGAVKGKRS
jgi:hypothetical protein